MSLSPERSPVPQCQVGKLRLGVSDSHKAPVPQLSPHPESPRDPGCPDTVQTPCLDVFVPRLSVLYKHPRVTRPSLPSCDARLSSPLSSRPPPTVLSWPEKRGLGGLGDSWGQVAVSPVHEGDMVTVPKTKIPKVLDLTIAVPQGTGSRDTTPALREGLTVVPKGKLRPRASQVLS